MSIEIPFTKENLNTYLSELAKEYKKRSGGMDAEIVLIGGASVLINYGFRDMTYDIDATYRAPSVMKEAINAVEDKFNLQTGWLNNDFEKTTDSKKRLPVLRSADNSFFSLNKMAERVGFEPTCRGRLTDFESASL